MSSWAVIFLSHFEYSLITSLIYTCSLAEYQAPEIAEYIIKIENTIKYLMKENMIGH